MPLVQPHTVCGGSLRGASPTLPSYPIVGVYGRPRGPGRFLASVEKCPTLRGGTPAAHGGTPTLGTIATRCGAGASSMLLPALPLRAILSLARWPTRDVSVCHLV